jgi:hypothetical protein
MCVEGQGRQDLAPCARSSKNQLPVAINTLSHKIDAWIIKQQLYTPHVIVLCNTEHQDSPSLLPVYRIPLWLPSQIGNKMPFDRWLADIKWRLHVAQAYESLDQLRNNLQIHSYLFRFKD